MRKHTITYVPLDSMSVGPNRQRKDLGDIEGLASSIAANGLINPITVSQNRHGVNQLVAGERRYRAFQFLRENNPGTPEEPGPYDSIPAVMYEDLDRFERYVLELEENVSRKDLKWQEQAIAALKLHMALETVAEDDPATDEWTPAMTADRIGKSRTWLRENVMVGRLLLEEDKQVMSCSTLSQAVNVIVRRRERIVQDKLNVAARTVSDTVHEKARPLAEESRKRPLDAAALGIGDEATPQGEASLTRPLGEDSAPLPPFAYLPEDSNIICGSFNHWAREYRGIPFNVIHCDFPYGIDHDKSDQGGSKRSESYEDDPKTYFSLIDTLIKYWDNFATPHAHVIFWYSMQWHTETVKLFTNAGFTVCTWPLIWYKSDNTGIASRPSFWPRHIYETALFITKGDRKILQPFGDCYAAPVHKLKSLHLSEKPVPMLKHFLKLTVDSNARVLDPTCGAGSALRAADDLGAELVIGIELKKAFADVAQQELEKARWKRKASQEQSTQEDSSKQSQSDSKPSN